MLEYSLMRTEAYLGIEFFFTSFQAKDMLEVLDGLEGISPEAIAKMQSEGVVSIANLAAVELSSVVRYMKIGNDLAETWINRAQEAEVDSIMVSNMIMWFYLIW